MAVRTVFATGPDKQYETGSNKNKLIKVTLMQIDKFVTIVKNFIQI
jgi:hypothetical protein